MLEFVPDRFPFAAEPCPRCAGVHAVEMVRFTSMPPEYTHWATCPTTGEPILADVHVRREQDSPKSHRGRS